MNFFSTSTTIAASSCRETSSHPGNGHATSVTMFAVLSGFVSALQLPFKCQSSPAISFLTYLDLGPPVPLGASGDEKPPPITVSGDPAGLHAS